MSATRTAFRLFPFTQSRIQKEGIGELTLEQRIALSIVSFNLEGINQYRFPQAFLLAFLSPTQPASFYPSLVLHSVMEY